MGEGDRPGLIDELAGLVADLALVYTTAPPGYVYPWQEVSTVVDSIESIDDLWVMEAAAGRIIAAGREVLAEIRRRMSRDIEELGSVRLGDTLYRSKPKWERSVIEGQEKPLLEWLGPDLKDAVNASDVRITAVRAIAERRGQTAKTVEETFYLYEEGDEAVLLRIPAARAPKYFATMTHGDRR